MHPTVWPNVFPFDPAQDRSLHTVVYAAIVAALHRGEMKPGDRITEEDIAHRLGISRSPVREAFVRLAQAGLITRRPRRGAFITEFSPAEWASIREARALLEGYGARQACARVADDDVAPLRDLVAVMVEAAHAGDWMRVVQANSQFHSTALDLSGNLILTRLWSSLDPLVWLQAASAPPNVRHDPDDVAARHTTLIEALLSGDGDRAERAFRDHAFQSAPDRAAPTDHRQPSDPSVVAGHVMAP
jgi:DNA-binding GntR family transcriptional regulator